MPQECVRSDSFIAEASPKHQYVFPFIKTLISIAFSSRESKLPCHYRGRSPMGRSGITRSNIGSTIPWPKSPLTAQTRCCWPNIREAFERSHTEITSNSRHGSATTARLEPTPILSRSTSLRAVISSISAERSTSNERGWQLLIMSEQEITPFPVGSRGDQTSKM